jgi:hypothetical protein
MKGISTPGLSRRDALAISMLVMTQITYTTWLLKAHLMMEWSLQLKCTVGLYVLVKFNKNKNLTKKIFFLSVKIQLLTNNENLTVLISI